MSDIGPSYCELQERIDWAEAALAAPGRDKADQVTGANVPPVVRLKSFMEQLQELKRWHNVMLDRENRVIELKREVNELLARAGEPPRYPSAMENKE